MVWPCITSCLFRGIGLIRNMKLPSCKTRGKRDQAGCHATRWARARASYTALHATIPRRDPSNSSVLSTVIALDITLTHCNTLNTSLRSNTTTLSGCSRPTIPQETPLTASTPSLIRPTMTYYVSRLQIFLTHSTRAHTSAVCGSLPASAIHSQTYCCCSYS